MDDKETIADTHRYIRLALPLMSKYNIPVTPRNYAVWYKYVSCSNDELNRTIDAMLERKEEFSEEKKETLYRQFCVEKGENELGKLREDLRQILLTILSEVAEITGQSEEYESFVSNSVNMLSEDASVQEIKNVISEIIDKTKTFGGFGKIIRNKLKETTDALEALKKDFEQVKTEALVDFLTGVPNRRAFDDSLMSLTSEATSDNTDLSLLLIDIDHFKRFNDDHGHLLGDKVLKFVAKKIREIIRGRDFLARFGGEEFAVILPQTTVIGAHAVGENIRSFFAQTPLKAVTTSRNLGTITVSIGVACYRKGELPEKFIKRSDQALYLAKNTGRNCVVAEPELVNRIADDTGLRDT
jgi:diguanylate cyclase